MTDTPARAEKLMIELAYCRQADLTHLRSRRADSRYCADSARSLGRWGA